MRCRFEEGAQQFRDDVGVNPNDTEEASTSQMLFSDLAHQIDRYIFYSFRVFWTLHIR